MNSTKLGLALTEQYEELLDNKLKQSQSEFADLFQGQITVFPSAPSHFRMRAEFRIWHDDDGAHYAMYEPGSYKKPVFIECFNIGSKVITELMPPLLTAINKSEKLKTKLFQAEFLTTLTGEALITLIYHRQLDESWQTEAEQLERDLNCSIIGRARKQKLVLSKDYVTETLPVLVGSTHYKQIETGFSQPNASVCVSMIDWACEQAQGLGGDLIELYCGNGNFTIPLSHHFEHVLATEVSKLSTRAAIDNIKLNNRSNIELVRLSAEEVAEALLGKRAFRRLAKIDIHRYQFSTIFVDPPRAGIDDATLEFVAGFDHVIYISCNPTTLKANLEHLSNTHSVQSMALFDQFPYTDHRECGVLLKRTSNKQSQLNEKFNGDVKFDG